MILFQEGLIIVGGNSVKEISINLNVLSAKQQSITSIPKGSPEQLAELVECVASGRVSSIFIKNSLFCFFFSFI